jgi:recombination protein RecA
MKKQQNIRFLTGSTLLDLVVGGMPNVYGYAVGKFINIVGDKSAGKTFLANEILASAYHKFSKKQFRWVYDDCEAGYSFDSRSMYGFDIIQDTENSTTVEEAFVNISNFAESLKADQFGIYVLDSLDGLTSDEQDEQAADRIKAHNAGKNYDKGTYGMGKPKYLSREFFPQLCGIIQDKNILVIIISQVRENIQPFSFEKYTRSGGKAMDFYAHTVLWLATLKKISKKQKPVGVVVKAKTTKSKTPRPFRDCQFSIIFDYGVDNIGSNLDFLYELRTDKGELTPAAKSISWGSGNTN